MQAIVIYRVIESFEISEGWKTNLRPFFVYSKNRNYSSPQFQPLTYLCLFIEKFESQVEKIMSFK